MSVELEAELRAVIEEKQQMLVKSAEFGKQLLETNSELEKQLEESCKSYDEKIEALHQEKHCLQLKLNCQAANLASLQHEVESIQRTMEEKHEYQLKKLEEGYQKKAREESARATDLRAELGKLEAQLKVEKDKHTAQEETISQLREEVRTYSGNTMLQHELNDLDKLLDQERSKSEYLEGQLLEVQGVADVLAVEKEGLQQKVLSVEEECQEMCRLSNEWFENLKSVKEQNMALKSELDLLKLEQKRGVHGESGNSLFGEVEDKRIEAERKMISLQVKFDSLEKTHSTTKQRYARLKNEMSALFCRYSATSADSEHLQRLQRALSQSQSENEGLRNKIHKLESQLADSGSVQERRKLMSAFGDFGDKAEYIKFLEHEIDQSKARHGSVLKELDVKRTQLVWESNKLSEAESKLYHSEQQNAKRKEELTKLRIRLQESTEKLNQSNSKIAQLEADKTFLEKEIKSRHKRSSHPSLNLDSTLHNSSITKSSSSSSLKNLDQNQATSNEQLPRSVSNDGLKSEGSEERLKKSISSEKLQPAPQKVYNLIEELETEFSGRENTAPLSSNVVHVSHKKTEQCSQQ